MRKLFLVFTLMAALMLFLAACGGGSDSDAPAQEGSNAARGEKLYKKTVIGASSAPGCSTCHSLEADVVLAGPSHAGLATRAETAVPGQSAEDYLHESIVNPDVHITDGFQAGVMYQNFGKDLSDQEVDDLVAFLMTLK